MIVCLVSHFFVVGVVGLINRLCWRCCLGKCFAWELREVEGYVVMEIELAVGGQF